MPRKKVEMQSYPSILWDVLKAAAEGRGFEITLPAKNFAVALRHRYHYFRRDTIAQGTPGAEKLANMMCSLQLGADGSAKLVFVNLGAVLEGEVEKHSAPPPGQGVAEVWKPPVQERVDDDPFERMLEAQLRERKAEREAGVAQQDGPTGQPIPNVVALPLKVNDGELTPAEVEMALGVGDFAETPDEMRERHKIEACTPHVWDSFGSCMECGVSRIAWERKDYARFPGDKNGA